MLTNIIPELKYFERLNKLNEIKSSSTFDKTIFLSILLIDEKNNHEYFSHKYNVPNSIKENLILLAKNLKVLKENKNFFDKDLEKNIYLHNKNFLINLNILNFVINLRTKLTDFSEILSRILKSKTHKFNIDGKYLIENGMQQGSLVGKALKEIEEEWIRNNFQITKERVKEIIYSYSN